MPTKKRFGRLLSLFSAEEDKELRHLRELVTQTLDQLGDKHAYVDRCRHWLNETHQAMSERPIDYDRAWPALLEIRHLFCRALPLRNLDRVVLDIQEDLAYLPADRTASQGKLHKISGQLAALSQKGEKAHQLQADGLRLELEHFSHLTANARLGQWYKINLYRKRLRKMGIFMAIELTILTLALMLYPLFSFKHDDVLVLFAVVGFGCLGGFLSALLTPEPLSQGSSAFYIERGLLLLRPTIGAVAGLVMFYLQKAGLVTIGLKEVGPSAYYIGAFGAGFSERFFVKKLAPMLGTHKAKEKSASEKEDEE